MINAHRCKAKDCFDKEVIITNNIKPDIDSNFHVVFSPIHQLSNKKSCMIIMYDQDLVLQKENTEKYY